MGRNKEPTDLKLLRGNPGKRDIDPDEYKPAPNRTPCPKYLDRYAKAVWNEYAPKLEKDGMLSEVDTLDFEALCISAGLLRKAYADLKKKKTLVMTSPTGYEQQRPEVGIINTMVQRIIGLSSKFGMSAADRSGLINPEAKRKRSKLSGLLSG
jgi:P27 family predicted phage terminase small subunit